MAPFSVIVFGVVVWRIAVSGAKQLRFRLWTGPKKAKFRRRTSHEQNRILMSENKGFFSSAFDSA